VRKLRFICLVIREFARMARLVAVPSCDASYIARLRYVKAVLFIVLTLKDELTEPNGKRGVK
jgi:hypothetical protein